MQLFAIVYNMVNVVLMNYLLARNTAGMNCFKINILQLNK